MLYRYNREHLLFEKVKTSSYIKGTLIGIFSIVLLGVGIVPKATIHNLTPEERIIVVREYNGFTNGGLVEYIRHLNFKYPHIVLAQTIQETGNYKSQIFKENNNLFGMKEAVIRTNLAKGTKRGHAYYGSWQESVTDYALYYATYLSDIRTEGEYFEYLRQNYAEDPTYVERLKTIIRKKELKHKFN